MTHNVRTQLDATWTTGSYVTLAADWQSLDAKVFKAINGDLGGCWAPSSQLIITGSISGQLQVNGPTVVDWGGSFKTTSSSRFNVANTTWPLRAAGHVSRSRTIVTPCLRKQTGSRYHWIVNQQNQAIQGLACTVQTSTSTLEQPSFYVPLRVHDGATIASATLTFRVPTARRAPPVAMPRLRIIRADANGVLVPLMSVASGADASGYISMATTTATAWYAGGLAQTLTYACDQNNVVDVSQYQYFAQVIEEVGTTTPIVLSQADGTIVRERKVDVRLASTADIGSPLTGALTVDGQTAATGDRILVKNQTLSANNGIWIAASGGLWARATDMSILTDFTPGAIVNVTAGTVNAGTSWELVSPTSVVNINLTTGVTPIVFQRRAPRGNIYHSVSVAMTGIADMRFQ